MRIDSLRLVNRRGWEQVCFANFLGSEKHMNSIPSFRIGPIQEHGDSASNSVYKTNLFHSFDGARQIFPLQQDIDITCGSHGRFIFLSDPSANCISAYDRVGDIGVFERPSSLLESFFYFLHRSVHPFPEFIAGKLNWNHASSPQFRLYVYEVSTIPKVMIVLYLVGSGAEVAL